MEKLAMSKKRLSEKELVEGMTPHTANADELAAVTLDELCLKPSESDYKAALVEEYEEKHFPI
ncbi:hypothetical protein [Vibrio sp. FJH11]